MIKVGLSKKKRISLGFMPIDSQILDRVLQLREIREIGIDSRAILYVCSVLAQANKFERLAGDLRELANHPKGSPQGVIYSNEEAEKAIEEMADSSAAYELALGTRQAVVIAPLRNLLAEHNPRYRSLKTALMTLTIDEIREQYELHFRR